MDLHPVDFQQIIVDLNKLAKQQNHNKVFAKVAAKYAPKFINAGYIIETAIPVFYNNEGDILFLVKYCNSERSLPEEEAMIALH